MNLFLLDAGGAGLVFGIMIIFMIAAVVIEALLMVVMKYNMAGKAFLDAFLVNLTSLVAGYILLWTTGELFYYFDSPFLNWLTLYSITVVIEFVILYLLNRRHRVGKTFLTCVIMNVASYVAWYLFTL